MERERKKADKLKKFAEKQAKTGASSATPQTAPKPKEKKKPEAAKETALSAYVEDTPPGEKKSEQPAVR